MSPQFKRGLILLTPLMVVAAMVFLFATTINRDSTLLPSVLINKPVPEFTLPAIEGIEDNSPGFSSADLVGEVTVVNVFASWCIPCRQEHPLLMDLAATSDIKIFGLNQKDAPENARQFLMELGNPYDGVGADTRGRVSIDWGVYGVPETFVINPEGIITYKQIGPLNEDSYRNGLLPAIEAAKNSDASTISN